jgi:lipopolysaccharide biosynthesis regulator YciM
MSELWWLLLPIAALFGWLSARHNLFGQSTLPSSTLSADYFKGLKYLLNEEPDKAIDIFIRLIDVDSDTVETHLALGTLFRRRGEVNRAIRIHQNLTARTNLSIQQRYLALLELGLDFRRAGLLDRAEATFQQLTSSHEHRITAYQQLLDIYQQEHEWEAAIDTALQLESASHVKMHRVIAQYYCEQVEALRQQGQREKALQAIQAALKIDSRCVRASLLEGQLALDNHDKVQAIQSFKRIEQQDADYLPEIIEPLQSCYRDLGQQHDFEEYLYHLLERYGGVAPTLLLVKSLREQGHEQQAVNFMVKQLHKQPSLSGLDQLLDLALLDTRHLTHEHFLLLKDMTHQLLKNRPLYKCNYCGFKGKSLHWLCPSCRQWNTIKPTERMTD